ncbi:Dihydrolipoamide succinyltransferase [Trifolium repens]|nr:Dihydrolipoamide succinyltransferase [Trifolium repens]
MWHLKDQCDDPHVPNDPIILNNEMMALFGDNVDVVVPPLAESIEDGTLAKFLKRPGDRVNADEPIAQIETDKALEAGCYTIERCPKHIMLTTFNEVDMTNLMKLRADHKDAFVEKHGVKLGLMSGFIKAAVNAIQYQPTINAVIDGDDIIYRDYIDISIAVGTPKGLVVPVIRNADTMNFADIEKQINTFAKKANAGTLSIDEMAGGTLTISNGGVYGTRCFSVMLTHITCNFSAIVGMHSIMTRPMVVGGVVVPRPMMNIALTYDHRIIDGREAVFFLRRIKDYVEDPRRLLLDI